MTTPHLIAVALALVVLTACSGGKENDALARERASMEAEAKAMASHQSKPSSAPEGAQPSVPASRRTQPEAGTRVPAGTTVLVTMGPSLSTRSAATGADWTGKLAEDLKAADGKLLAKAGSAVTGRIVLASDGSNLRRKHELEIRVYRLQSVSGEQVDIRTTSFIAEGADAGQRPAIIQADSRLEFHLTSETSFP